MRKNIARDILCGIGGLIITRHLLPKKDVVFNSCKEIDWNRQKDMTYDPHLIFGIERYNCILFDYVQVHYDSIPIAFGVKSYHFRRINPIIKYDSDE